MKVIVAGSRSLGTWSQVTQAIVNSGWEKDITEIVSGTARGVDTMGELYANTYNIPIRRFPANWSKYGKAAGPIRNREMAEYADMLIAVWDGKSPGTGSMIRTMQLLAKPLYVEVVK